MDAKVIEALKVISDYCDNTQCEECCIARWCDVERLKVSPWDWDLSDLEDGE